MQRLSPRLADPSFRQVLEIGLFSVTFLVIVFSSYLIVQTTDLICANDGARAFLEKIRTVPLESWKIPVFALSLWGVMMLSTVLRTRFRGHFSVQILFSTLDLTISLVIVVLLDFSYRGVIFIAILNALRFVGPRGGRIGMAALCVLAYILVDYDIVSLQFPVFSINDYVDFYRNSIRLVYYGAKNLLVSLNEILFIIYLVLEIQTWIEENQEIRKLNHRLVKMTEDLQLTNVRLEAYAARSEESARIRERNRLAREIHDIVAHALTGIEIGLKACLDVFRTDPERVYLQLGKIASLARSGVEDMRRSVFRLKNEPIAAGSFLDSLSRLVEGIGECTGARIEVVVEGTPRVLSPVAEETLYRSAQESLTNAVGHGEAQFVEVELRYNPTTVELVVRDDGKGSVVLTEGLGLRHMRERTESLGGQIFFTNRSKGFLVQVSLPALGEGEVAP